MFRRDVTAARGHEPVATAETVDAIAGDTQADWSADY
jgi:hypothetical protein